MTSITTAKTETTSVLLFATLFVDKNRRYATDRYWSLLLVLAIVAWILYGPRIYLQNDLIRQDCEIDSDNSSTSSNSTFDLLQNQSDGKTPINLSSQIWGKNWILDVILCNAAFIDANYERNGAIVIWAHILFSIYIILYALTSMRPNKGFRCYFISFIAYTLIFHASISRMMLMYLYPSENRSITGSLLWTVPELIVFFIMCTKAPFFRRTNKNCIKMNDDGRISWSGIQHYPLSSMMVMVYFTMIIYTILLIIKITNPQIKMDWNNNDLSSTVGTIVICYILSTLYHFLLIVTSCASCFFIEKRKANVRKYCRAMFIVARYHLGTVCYHATLIFPRLHSLIVINDRTTIKETPELSALSRFYLTQTKLHDLSMTMTAIYGYNHSTSMRELLRYFAVDSPKFKNFQLNINTSRCTVALLMTSQCLFIICSWINGVIFDPLMITQYWNAYVFGLYAIALLAWIYDAGTDTLCFYIIEEQKFKAK